MKTCPVCGEGDVTEVVHYNDYWDEHFARWSILTKGYKCDHCLSEFADAAQVSFNAKQVSGIKELSERMYKEDEL